jgi:hypothetical protein
VSDNFKGINLNYKNTLDINYDILKDIVTGEKKEYNMQRLKFNKHCNKSGKEGIQNSV